MRSALLMTSLICAYNSLEHPGHNRRVHIELAREVVSGRYSIPRLCMK
jgi:hypothetical protein